MGLDSVELVMAVEEEFNLVIADEDAEKICTVGEFNRYLINECKNKQLIIDDDEIWRRLKKVIVYQLGVKPEQVTKHANFVYDLGMD